MDLQWRYINALDRINLSAGSIVARSYRQSLSSLSYYEDAGMAC